MGDYTQLTLDIEVRPDKVEEIQAYLDNSRIGNTSYYFEDQGLAEIEIDALVKARSTTGELMHKATLHVSTSLKNYQSDIEKFLDFLSDGRAYPPHTKTFVGYSRYEYDEDPTLLYVSTGGTIIRKEVTA